VTGDHQLIIGQDDEDAGWAQPGHPLAEVDSATS
jgi:hypothetical protein